MRQGTLQAEVLVVGAGPVGLTAAALLSSRGHEVVVLERNSSTSDEPKAISIDDEALRTFAQAGLDGPLLPLILPGSGTRYYGADGAALFHAGTDRPFRLGFPFKNPFAQPDLERELLRHLRARPNVRFHFDTVVQSAAQGPDGVSVDAVSAGVARSYAAEYLIGADGGRSVVRSAMDVRLQGRSHPDLWLVVDTRNDAHVERYGMHHGDPRRPHVIVPGREGRCRYEFRLFDGEATAGEEPSLELLRDVLSPHRALEPEDVERAVVYRFHGLVADRWRKGRMFVMGDAAHMMPPFAGQGLNSGIRDAANLCWKLSSVLHGTAPETILDSYEAERLPHALQSVRLSEKLGRVVMTVSERLATFRDDAVRRALDTTEGRELLENMRFRPPARFTSGLVTGDGEGIGCQVGQPRVFATPGGRISMLDDVVGDGWALFDVEVSTPLSATLPSSVARFDVALSEERRIDPGARTLLDVDGSLLREFTPWRGRRVLVRPDHVVAAAWEPVDDATVVTEITTWFVGEPVLAGGVSAEHE